MSWDYSINECSLFRSCLYILFLVSYPITLVYMRQSLVVISNLWPLFWEVIRKKVWTINPLGIFHGDCHFRIIAESIQKEKKKERKKLFKKIKNKGITIINGSTVTKSMQVRKHDTYNFKMCK